MAQSDHAEALRRLHGGPEPLLLPNVWDVATARTVTEAGFPVVATSSAAVAASLGFGDHEQTPVDEMLRVVERIARSVEAPVTADLEAGYGLEPAELAERVIATGAVGLNLEDSDHRGGQPLRDAEWQADWLGRFKSAARTAGVDLVLNARVDVHIRQVGPPEGRLEEALRRARLYVQAGADCVYPIGVCDEPTIAAFVEGVPAPVNILLRGGCPSLARLAELGVRRVSLAAGLYRAGLKHVRLLVDELKAGNPAPILG
jgi:2-methylisocitrate lyase-like PEP mutase family enzyme